MVAEQAELNLRTRRDGAARLENDRRELAQLLRGRGWVTAAAIERLRPEWRSADHRYVRKLAQPRKGEPLRVISGPGTHGYHLAADIPLEDLRGAAARRKQQGRELFRGGVQLAQLAALRAREDALTGETP